MNCPCCDYSCNTCFVYRKDIAKLLGYENYAQMSMETKMAGSVENVMNMIERSVVLVVSLYSPYIYSSFCAVIFTKCTRRFPTAGYNAVCCIYI